MYVYMNVYITKELEKKKEDLRQIIIQPENILYVHILILYAKLYS